MCIHGVGECENIVSVGVCVSTCLAMFCVCDVCVCMGMLYVYMFVRAPVYLTECRVCACYARAFMYVCVMYVLLKTVHEKSLPLHILAFSLVVSDLQSVLR